MITLRAATRQANEPTPALVAGLTAAGFATATWNWNSGLVLGRIPASDLLLVMAVFAAVLSRTPLSPERDRRSLAIVFGAAALTVVGAAIGVIFRETTMGADVIPFVAASSVSIYLVSRADNKTVERLVVAVSAGAAVNGLAGFALGPTIHPNRISGLSNHPNTFGFAAILVIAGAGWIVLSRFTIQRMALACLLTGCAVMMALRSGSRAAALGVAVAVVGAFAVNAIKHPRQALRAGVAGFVTLIAVLISGVLADTIGFQRLTGSDSSAAISDTARATERAASMEVINANPLLGSGFSEGTRAHSAPIQMWEIGGILGLIGAVLVVVALIVRPLVSARRSRSPKDKQLVLRALPLGLATLAYLAFSNVLWERYVWVALSMAAAAWVQPASIYTTARRAARTTDDSSPYLQTALSAGSPTDVRSFRDVD